jgi:hypothetical protein
VGRVRYFFLRDLAEGPAPVPLLSVRICTSHDATLYKELPVQNVIELNFSPLGTFLSTWERVGEFLGARTLLCRATLMQFTRSEARGRCSAQEPASLVRFYRRRGHILHPEVTRRMVGR